MFVIVVVVVVVVVVDDDILKQRIVSFELSWHKCTKRLLQEMMGPLFL